MWPFTRNTRREEDRLREMLGGHVSEDVLEKILARSQAEARPPQPWQFAYVLFQVRDADLDKVPARLSSAIEILTRRDGFVADMMSSVVLGIFGLPLVDEDLEKSRGQQAKVVARLVDAFGNDIRIVYGLAQGLAGDVGAPSNPSFGVLLPDLASKLGALFALAFGKAAQI